MRAGKRGGGEKLPVMRAHRFRQKETEEASNDKRLGCRGTEILHEPVLKQGQSLVKWITIHLRSWLQSRRNERLLEVVLDILKILETDANTDQVWGDSTLDLFLVGQLLVSGDPWVDDEGFGITDVSQMTAQLQIVDNCPDFFDSSSL